ncbi:MAG: DUF4263 domain-containing protein [Pseudomonadales bacterium]|nr:DUF4263 domain-containing protein [Pseudomonadales bacterium]
MKDERLEKDLKTKQIFHFIDTDAGIDQKSKEIYKNKDLIVHFPRGFEGGPKYNTIRKISIVGFKEKIPVGLIKSPFYGYGFTRTLRPFARFLDENYKLKEVRGERGGIVKIDKTNGVLHINEKVLQKLQDAFSLVFAKNSAEVQAVLERVSHEIFPKEVKEPKANYIKNSLSQAVAAWGNTIDEFSDADKEAIAELFESLSSETEFLSKESLQETKVIVEVRLIKKALDEFDKLFARVTDTTSLEKTWQTYLKGHAWIFSAIFAQPVILFKDEAYAGGKNIDNRGGKFTDFLVKNSLTENVAFFEIKTHKTPLLEKRPYRGADVFSTSKDLSGCLSQVLDQRDKFQKSFANLKLESEESFESINSACFVIIGSIDSLTKQQRHSFELIRTNSRDVQILTFDEVRSKISLLGELAAKED